jgi:tRNA (mo5U34)-methyltransferase
MRYSGSASLQPEEIRERVGAIRWFHRIDLGNGIVTPGLDDSRWKLDWLQLPERLDGLSVLDIGAWDGFFSFECERRGAKRVVACDKFVWNGGGGGTKAGFELARRVLRSRVRDTEVDVYDLDSRKPGVFDLVLFLGVLYHLKHPLLALEKVAAITRGALILETLVDLRTLEHPAMRYYPGGERDGDPTNWWGPNPAAVRAMLETVGFVKTRDVTLIPLDDDVGRFVIHASK